MKNFILKPLIKVFSLTFSVSLAFSCGQKTVSSENTADKVLYTSVGGKINTLDPVLAADLVSQYMTAAFYDTLLQYDYVARPYKLVPSMLAEMPETSADMKHYTFKLRDDLYFQQDKCFRSKKKEDRKVTSADVVFSFLRIADARIHSPGFWLFRHKIKGIDEFRELTTRHKPGDMSPYKKGCEGFEIIDDRTFTIHLTKPDPRLLYALAMPYAGVVSPIAVQFYGQDFAEHPVGSGPFRMLEWIRDYRIILERNPDYRHELFTDAESPEDRKHPLPLLDKIVCYLVKQPLASWLLFLQGEMDMNALNKENFEVVVNYDLKLAPALVKRGIKMIKVPDFQVNYIGFSFTDPLLSENLRLRKAISLAYNVDLRVRHFNNCIIPAHGPIPPGVAGYDKNFHNPYSHHNLDEAKKLLREAGFPGGIDPKSGKALELTFDQSGNSPQHRQIAELMVNDMREIGINIKPVLNNKPRFFQKLRKGQLQLFRLSWIGDYPDAENFLQLFYGPNAGSCNRVFYKDKKFDTMYHEIISMPDCPERTAKYKRMSEYITRQCPWIFESFPISYRLIHSWVENYVPHDFAFSRWKYLSLNPNQRQRARKNFKPIKMSDLRKK